MFFKELYPYLKEYRIYFIRCLTTKHEYVAVDFIFHDDYYINDLSIPDEWKIFDLEPDKYCYEGFAHVQKLNR
jgi:hypothetical protein